MGGGAVMQEANCQRVKKTISALFITTWLNGQGHRLGHRDTDWDTGTQSGTQGHRLEHRDTDWDTGTQTGTQGHRLEHRDTDWDTNTDRQGTKDRVRDTQRDSRHTETETDTLRQTGTQGTQTH